MNARLRVHSRLVKRDVHFAAPATSSPIHPGEFLAEDLQRLGIKLRRLAHDLRVPVNRISAIINGKRSITPDTALRLSRYFGTSPQYWMNLQTAYDLAVAVRSKGATIDRDVHPLNSVTGYETPKLL